MAGIGKENVMKKQMTLMALCSSLVAAPSLADDLSHSWPRAGCDWAWGCRYTYQIPNPPPGKRWALVLSTTNSVNDGNVWMRAGNQKVAMDRWGRGNEHIYKGAMPSGGEIEFWMPFRSSLDLANARYFTGNGGYLSGTLVDANLPHEKRPW